MESDQAADISVHPRLQESEVCVLGMSVSVHMRVAVLNDPRAIWEKAVHAAAE